MSVKTISDEGQVLSPPRGKVLGVVTKAQFEEVVKALEEAGFDKIKVFQGVEGIHLLERIQGFLLSDSEGEVLQQDIQELNTGHIVIEIHTPSGRADEAAKIASAHGATYLMHFGFWGVTWLKV